MALCISVLELLQWKEDVQDEAQLLDPLSQVLRHLLDSAAQPSPAVERKSNADDMDTSNDEGTDAESVDVDSSDTARRRDPQLDITFSNWCSTTHWQRHAQIMRGWLPTMLQIAGV